MESASGETDDSSARDGGDVGRERAGKFEIRNSKNLAHEACGFFGFFRRRQPLIFRVSDFEFRIFSGGFKFKCRFKWRVNAGHASKKKTLWSDHSDQYSKAPFLPHLCR
jgi:hypothetical protein